jgi:hypothetical protein
MDDSLEYDIQNFDDTFLAMEPTVKEGPPVDGQDSTDPDATITATEPISPEAFSGYDFKDRDLVSVVMEDDEDEVAQLGRPSIEQAMQQAEIEPNSTDGPAEPVKGVELVDNTSTVVPTRLPSNGTAPSASLPSRLNDATLKRARHSKELSGIDALDRQFELTRSTTNTTATDTATDDLDIDDDEWDMIDQDQNGIAANGRRARDTFFARGVVDRYKLAVLKRRESSKLRRSPSSSLIFGRRINSIEEDGPPTASRSLGNLKSRFRVRPKISPVNMSPGAGGSLARSGSSSRSENYKENETSGGSTEASEHSSARTHNPSMHSNPGQIDGTQQSSTCDRT